MTKQPEATPEQAAPDALAEMGRQGGKMIWQTFDGNNRPKSEEPMLLKLSDGLAFGFYDEALNSWRGDDGGPIRCTGQYIYLKDLVAELEGK